MRAARYLIVALAVNALLACGASPTLQASSSPQTSSSPEANAPPESWRELTSEHFVIWTNASEARARALVQTIENLRQVVLGVSFFNKELKGRSLVIALRTVDEIHLYVEQQFIAHAWSARSVLRQPVIALAAESLDDNRQIVTHELTHVIAFNVIVNQPRWFAEGIAGYFETIRLDEHHAKLDIGVPLEGRLRLLQEKGITPIASVFACDQPACIDDRFYATTWALFTYLLNQHPDELQTYMRQLVVTPAEHQAQLWSQVFVDLPVSKVEQELIDWIRHGKVRVSQYSIALHDWPFTERPLTEADGLAAKGTIRYLLTPTAAPSPEIARALALDPTNMLATMVQAAATGSVTADQARSVTAAHPDDWRAWSLAWRAATDRSARNEAREKTCTLFDANPTAYPIEQCARDATGVFLDEAHEKVFKNAWPQIGVCMRKSKLAELGDKMTIDFDVDDTGAVTGVRASVGSAETDACVAGVVQKLVFPAHHAGTFHRGASRTAAKP